MVWRVCCVWVRVRVAAVVLVPPGGTHWAATKLSIEPSELGDSKGEPSADDADGSDATLEATFEFCATKCLVHDLHAVMGLIRFGYYDAAQSWSLTRAKLHFVPRARFILFDDVIVVVVRERKAKIRLVYYGSLIFWFVTFFDLGCSPIFLKRIPAHKMDIFVTRNSRNDALWSFGNDDGRRCCTMQIPRRRHYRVGCCCR